MIGHNLDVLIIGGGQAGLAMGYHLKRAGHRFQIVERNARVGESWRNRHDSLVLFTPRAYSALPGLSVPGDPDGYPNKDEMADYLEHYVNYFELPVSTETGSAPSRKPTEASARGPTPARSSTPGRSCWPRGRSSGPRSPRSRGGFLRTSCS
jgi:putative flavoprotein involved in K+ transport